MDEAEAYLALESAVHDLLAATGESPDLEVAKFALVIQVWDTTIPTDHSRYLSFYAPGLAMHEAMGLLRLESLRLARQAA
jgi:hypothetical protein